MIPTLPVQHEVQPTGLDCHDDLLQNGAQNPLARFDGSSCVVPERWQVAGKRHKGHALVIADGVRLLAALRARGGARASRRTIGATMLLRRNVLVFRCP
jgi:hypothetical protein